MRSIDLARKAFGTGPSEWLPVCLFARRGHTVFWALSSIALCAQEAHVLVRILSKLQYTRSQSCLAPTVSAIVAPRAPIRLWPAGGRIADRLMLGFDRKIPPACKPPPIAIEKLNPQILAMARGFSGNC
jgi:hypothetical protein